MAWSWSHTPEAYANARENLNYETHNNLCSAYAEIKCHDLESPNADYEGFDETHYHTHEDFAKTLTKDELIEAIWDFAEDDRTCDNGGFNAWYCPYGCHTVSFSSNGENA